MQVLVNIVVVMGVLVLVAAVGAAFFWLHLTANGRNPFQ